MVQIFMGIKPLLSWSRNSLLFETSNVKYSFYGSLPVVPSPSLVKPNSFSHLFLRSTLILFHCRYFVHQTFYGLKTLNWLVTTSLSASCPIHRILYQFMVTMFSEIYTLRCSTLCSYIHPDVTTLQLKIVSLKFTFDPVPALVRQALFQTKLTCDSNPG
jgi:hypothetical protein